MYKEVELTKNNGEAIKLPFKTTGTTAYRYRQVFRKDLMPLISKLVSDDENINKESDMLVAQELAFIMNKQAEGRDMSTVTFEEYLTWIEQFSSECLIQNISTFITMYTGSKNTLSEPKKEDEP